MKKDETDRPAFLVGAVMPCTSFEGIGVADDDGVVSVWTDGMALSNDDLPHRHYTLEAGKKYKVVVYEA